MAGGALNMRVESRDLRRLARKMAGVTPRMDTATARALHHTGGKMMTRANKEIRNIYNVKAGDVRAVLKLEGPSALGRRQRVAVVAGGRRPSLFYFGALPKTNEPYLAGGKRPPRGVSVKIYRNQPRRRIPRSFIVASIGRAATGNWAKATPANFGTGTRSGAFYQTEKFTIFQRKRGAPRTPIRALYGPSPARMLSRRAVYEPALEYGAGQLAARLTHEMTSLISGRTYRSRAEVGK